MCSIPSSFAGPGDALAWATEAGPCGAVLDVLAAIDPGSLDESGRVTLLRLLDQHASWVAALSVRTLAAVAGPAPRDPCSEAGRGPDDPVRDEVRAALRISGPAAMARIGVARDLAARLPGTLSALSGGRISYGHAVAMCEESLALDIEQCRRFEELVLPEAAVRAPGQARRAARRVAAGLVPPAPAEVIEAEFARRTIRLDPVSSVMAQITAVLPAPDAMSVWNALTAMGLAVPRSGTDHRSLDHKRADALAELAQRALDEPGLPEHQGRKRLETHLVMDLPTLLGLAGGVCELAGFGPIPPVLARRLAAESGWRRLVTDPADGHLLDYGRTVYRPPAWLREYVIARDRTCSFPTCSQPAWTGDLDHVIQPEQGGATSAANLRALCRRHHQLKTHGGWDLTADSADGSSKWTSPAGHDYQTGPPAIGQPPPTQPPDPPPIAATSRAGRAPGGETADLVLTPLELQISIKLRDQPP